MFFTSKPIYDNCKKLFCNRHKSRVISAEETTQKFQKKVLDHKCTDCGNIFFPICHLIAHARSIHNDKTTLLCSRMWTLKFKKCWLYLKIPSPVLSFCSFNCLNLFQPIYCSSSDYIFLLSYKMCS